MTRRPRSHQLETLSRVAFSSSLPPNWVFRDLALDYGLDGMVEIFDEQGSATGHLFFVQLKGTDGSALQVRLPRRLVDYYATLSLPVLLVLFHAPTSTLYACWVKEGLDPAPRESESVTVWLSADDSWNPARLPAIVAELEESRAAVRLGNRELRIQRYYEQRQAINPADEAKGPERPHQRFNTGERVFHGVFGWGTVDQESENCLFVQFDADNVVRKFNPGDTWEFVGIS